MRPGRSAICDHECPQPARPFASPLKKSPPPPAFLTRQARVLLPMIIGWRSAHQDAQVCPWLLAAKALEGESRAGIQMWIEDSLCHLLGQIGEPRKQGGRGRELTLRGRLAQARHGGQCAASGAQALGHGLFLPGPGGVAGVGNLRCVQNLNFAHRQGRAGHLGAGPHGADSCGPGSRPA